MEDAVTNARQVAQRLDQEAATRGTIDEQFAQLQQASQEFFEQRIGEAEQRKIQQQELSKAVSQSLSVASELERAVAAAVESEIAFGTAVDEVSNQQQRFGSAVEDLARTTGTKLEELATSLQSTTDAVRRQERQIAAIQTATSDNERRAVGR